MAAARFSHRPRVVRIVALALSLLAPVALTNGDGPRARWACGILAGYDVAYAGSGNTTDITGMGGGLYTRGGLQWDDRLDIELDVSAASLLFLGFIRTALLAGLTYDWLTVSAGPMVAANYLAFVESPGGTATYAGVGARVDFQFWQHGGDTGRRWAFTASLAADAGYALQEFGGRARGLNSFAWGAYTSIGPTWY